MKNKTIKILVIILVIYNVVVSSAVGYAATQIYSRDVYYNNEKTNLASTDLQGALDELYDEANDYVELLHKVENNILDKTYPVGSIYMSISNTNPSELFGGTWLAWGSGRVPVGVNTSDSNFNTIEKTGGEATVALTVAQLPSHNHNIGVTADSGIVGLHIEGVAGSGVNVTHTWYLSPNGPFAKGDTTNTGGGQAHNNLQPYITCYMWKRTK